MEMDHIHAYLMWWLWFSLRPMNVEFLVDTWNRIFSEYFVFFPCQHNYTTP